MVPLNDLNEGESGEIVAIYEPESQSEKADFLERCRRKHCRVNEMGLRKGKVVQILRKQKRGPMLLKVDDSRIAIDKGIIDCIQIRNLS